MHPGGCNRHSLGDITILRMPFQLRPIMKMNNADVIQVMQLTAGLPSSYLLMPVPQGPAVALHPPEPVQMEPFRSLYEISDDELARVTWLGRHYWRPQRAPYDYDEL